MQLWRMMMNKRLLVVDDNQGVRFLLRELLTSEGYEVLDAANAQEAIFHAANDDLSLVLLDIKMPGMTGLEALNHIKTLSPNLPVILISAYSEMNMLNKALKLHPQTLFISKPFDLDHVRKIVKNILFDNRQQNFFKGKFEIK
jgi:two-component system response regulator (stage 0 sporulation protein F)